MFGKCALELRFRSALGAAVLAATIIAQPTIDAVGAEPDFHKGKVFTVVIGYAPGGGYDAYGRLVAEHVGRYIPGNPSVVAQNMPGASSIRAANYIFAKAPKDGTAVGLFASSAAFAPVFGNKAAQFQPEQFTWIGNLDQATGTCSVWHETGMSSFKDILERPAIFGASGPAGFDSEYARALNAMFGTRIRVIHGYNGATSVLLAMKRGEVQGGCGFPLGSLKSVRRDDFQAKRLIPIVQFALKSSDLKGVPHVTDLARTDDDRKIYNLIFNRDILGRPIAAPPGLPADRASLLRKAFAATFKDERFRADAERRHLTLDVQSGEEVEAFVREMTSYSSEIVARAQDALKVGKVESVELKSLDGTIAKVLKGAIEIKGSDGKLTRLKVSDRNTSILVGGSKVKAGDLNPGLSCSLRHFGAGDFAKTIACR